MICLTSLPDRVGRVAQVGWGASRPRLELGSPWASGDRRHDPTTVVFLQGIRYLGTALPRYELLTIAHLGLGLPHSGFVSMRVLMLLLSSLCLSSV